MINFFKKHNLLILILLLQIPLILPFFHKGFFPSHDDVQVTRVFEMTQSLKFGDVPPRWSANLLYGYGYPLYIFYSPLSYFIGAFFTFIGSNFLLATKAVFILSFLIGGIGMYLLVKKLFGNLPAIVSAVAFSLAPYRALDVYVRGNLAEFFSFSLFPIVFLADWNLINSSGKEKTKNILLLAFLFFLLEISHNLSCFIYFIFLFVFDLSYLFFEKRKKIFFESINLFKALVLSLSFSAFYILPLLVENQFVKVGKFLNSPYQNYFLDISKIWHTPWGWNGFIEENPMSLQLGKVLIISSFVCFIINQKIKSKYRYVINIMFGLFILLTFLEVKESIFVWKIFPIMSFLQFPWRMHIITTFLASVLTGGILFLCVQEFNRKLSRVLVLFIAAIFIFLLVAENINFFKPRLYWSIPYVSETTTWDDEYLPKWVQIKPKDYASEKVILDKKIGTVSDLAWGYLKKEFTIQSTKDIKIQIAHVYYPGWEVSIDGNKSAVKYDNPGGLMEISIPQGRHKVIFVFQRTWWRTLADYISIAGFLVFAVLIIKAKNEEKNY